MSIVFLVISFLFLIYGAYRGFSILVLAPAVTLITVLCASHEPALAMYTQVFMQKCSGFVASYFPIFLLSAIFGKLMQRSGCAASIALGISRIMGPRRAVLSVILSSAILTYGGVSLFVVVFAIYPIACQLFKEANIPKRLMPGAIMVGACTFTMTALPGSPAIQNIIPGQFFGTSSLAAPVFGLLASALLFGAGFYWLEYRARTARNYGEGYIEQKTETSRNPENSQKLPSFVTAALPIATVVLVNLCCSIVFPHLDTAYLAEQKYGATTIQTVLSSWSLIIALLAAVSLLILLHRTQLTSLRGDLECGAQDSLIPIFNTASVIGYGSVVVTLPVFSSILGTALNALPTEKPTISLAVGVSVLCGITGSASGGLMIALPMLGQELLALAKTLHISPDLLHRVASLASGGLGTLPHNGAIITLLGVCGLTHRESYFDIFIAGLVVPILVTILIVALGSGIGCF